MCAMHLHSGACKYYCNRVCIVQIIEEFSTMHCVLGTLQVTHVLYKYTIRAQSHHYEGLIQAHPNNYFYDLNITSINSVN